VAKEVYDSKLTFDEYIARKSWQNAYVIIKLST
jgi:hypothetical protein